MKKIKSSLKKIIPQIEPYFDMEEEEELLKVIRSTWIAEGEQTKKFEDMVADFLGVKYASAVPNGTLAITLSCLAIGIKPEDEVIIPDLTMAGTANGVILAGGKPVFADIKLSDLTIDINEIKKKTTKKTRAIIPVHFNGRGAEMEAILEFARKNKLYVIEDAAQAFGSKSGEKYLGTIGDIGCFSFSIPKIVTTGQGGMVVTNRKDLYNKLVGLRDHGRRKKGVDIHDSIGFNFRFTDLQAAVGVAQMKKINYALKKKKEIFKLYKKLLDKTPCVRFIKTDLTKTLPWFVDVLVSKIKPLALFLKNNGVYTRIFYPPLHSQSAYKKLNPKRKDTFGNAVIISREGLWLPSSVSLTRQQIERICNLIKVFYLNEPEK